MVAREKRVGCHGRAQSDSGSESPLFQLVVSQAHRVQECVPARVGS
jgi:hypothetical protein